MQRQAVSNSRRRMSNSLGPSERSVRRRAPKSTSSRLSGQRDAGRRSRPARGAAARPDRGGGRLAGPPPASACPLRGAARPPAPRGHRPVPAAPSAAQAASVCRAAAVSCRATHAASVAAARPADRPRPTGRRLPQTRRRTIPPRPVPPARGVPRLYQVGGRPRGHVGQLSMGVGQHVAVLQPVGQLQRKNVGQLSHLFLQVAHQRLQLRLEQPMPVPARSSSWPSTSGWPSANSRAINSAR